MKPILLAVLVSVAVGVVVLVVATAWLLRRYRRARREGGRCSEEVGQAVQAQASVPERELSFRDLVVAEERQDPAGSSRYLELIITSDGEYWEV
jgi:Flp pilus assembly protein TadB